MDARSDHRRSDRRALATAIGSLSVTLYALAGWPAGDFLAGLEAATTGDRADDRWPAPGSGQPPRGVSAAPGLGATLAARPADR